MFEGNIDGVRGVECRFYSTNGVLGGAHYSSYRPVRLSSLNSLFLFFKEHAASMNRHPDYPNRKANKSKPKTLKGLVLLCCLFKR